MNLSEIFAQLAAGELSQMGMVDITTGEIAEAKQGQVLSHVNLALTALYKRFPLKEGRATLRLKAGRVTYRLDTNADVTFITPSNEDEFNDDILKIERVYTSGGVELALNDLADPYSCFTPSANTLRIPAAMAGVSSDLPPSLVTSSLTVVYRANHPILRKGNGVLRPSSIEVELPYTHLEPLLLFVASRVNNPIGMTNEFHAGNSYAAKYEQACQQLEILNLRVDQGSGNTRLQRSGWV